MPFYSLMVDIQADRGRDVEKDRPGIAVESPKWFGIAGCRT